MDNLPRYPDGWTVNGQVITIRNLNPNIFVYEGLSPVWNRQGRIVDFSAQMVLFARNLATIAEHVGQPQLEWTCKADALAVRINQLCWHDTDSTYYALGYGLSIRRAYIGAHWMLMADAVPEDRINRFIELLFDPDRYWRTFPTPTVPADSPLYSSTGGILAGRGLGADELYGCSWSECRWPS